MSTLVKWLIRLPLAMALKEAGKKCKPAILEPIMFVEVTAPE